jgi:Zinc finger C-x8-C-x5-C-x3-H type (and similar)
VSFCRDLQTRGTCARGQNCNFAHSDEELDRYRAKYKKNAMRNIIQNQNNQHKESSSAVNAVSNGPISKVNMNYAKCSPPSGAGGNDTSNSTIMPSRLNSLSSSSSSSKQIPYRSENSLHHSSSKTQPLNHLRPSNVYNSPGSSTSSNSTPNLSQMQLSPNQVVNAKTSPQQQQQQQQGNSRFSFNGRGNGDVMHSSYNYHSPQQNRQIPLSTPPISNSNFKKQMSPYHNPNVMNNNNSSTRHQQTQQMPSSARMSFNGNGNAFFGQGSSPVYRSGGETSGKFMPWQQQLRSPSSLYGTSNMKSPKSVAGVGSSRTSMEPSTSRMLLPYHQRDNIDEVDGPNASSNRWQQSLATKANHHHHAPPTAVSSTYPLFHTPKGGFLRSDSLLATSNADETYENIATNGKYGAIGIKTTDALQKPQTQWSGLQQTQTLGNRFDNNGFGSCSSSSTSSIGSNALKTNDTLNPNDESVHHHSGGFNGNFINIHVSKILNFQ